MKEGNKIVQTYVLVANEKEHVAWAEGMGKLGWKLKIIGTTGDWNGFLMYEPIKTPIDKSDDKE